MRIAALALLVLVFAGARAEAQPQAPTQAWVQYVQGGAQIRATTTAPACPEVVIDGHGRAMAERAGPAVGFGNRLCQLDLPAGARTAKVDGRALPLPTQRPKRILIFGDTGCRLKDGDFQACNDPRAWPFAAVARLAAAQHPDVVIHVGDYYYREAPCPVLVSGCAGTPSGDNWASWRADFFEPAAPLLAAAPWVFARGNHEACGRGSTGWFRMLDAAPRPAACPATSQAFVAALGDLNLYVLDSSGADDKFAPDAKVAAFAGQLDALKVDLAKHPGWIITHRPIWGLTPIARVGPIGPVEFPINRTEQVAVAGRDLSAVQMVVSGHIHHFASFSFGKSRPAQLIAGTGGDVGEPADTPRVRETDPTIDGLAARRLSFERFGYFLLDRQGADWVGVFRDLDNKLVANCRLHGRALICWDSAPKR
jgi:hypothetical protein